MSEGIKPALTPEEWAALGVGFLIGHDLLARRYKDGDLGIYGAYEGGIQDEEERHAIAAACLYGQPFGFRHEMADAIDRALSGETIDEATASLLRTTVQVILSLLPPRRDDAGVSVVREEQGG